MSEIVPLRVVFPLEPGKSILIASRPMAAHMVMYVHSALCQLEVPLSDQPTNLHVDPNRGWLIFEFPVPKDYAVSEEDHKRICQRVEGFISKELQLDQEREDGTLAWLH